MVPKRSYVHVLVVRAWSLSAVLPVRAVGGVYLGSAGRVGTGRGYTGYYPPTHRLVLPGPNPLPYSCFCVHQGTPGLLHSPSAHPGSSHSDTGLLANKGEIPP